jgi:hypothetical protein
MVDPAKVDPFSRGIAYLTMMFDGRPLATGSGTLVRINDQWYLLTALHNLSGREPCGKIKHSMGSVPNQVRIEAYCYDRTENLYAGSNACDEASLFLMHPKGPSVDVTLLPLQMPVPEVSALHESFLNPRQNESMRLYVSQDCHIVGFPEGLVDKTHPQMPLAIWKTGHIASEPTTDFQGEPVVIVDATTRPGMSGAPVLVRRLTMTGAPFQTRLVGVYTGRVGMKNGDSALGKVFKPRVINEIADASQKYVSPLD